MGLSVMSIDQVVVLATFGACDLFEVATNILTYMTTYVLTHTMSHMKTHVATSIVSTFHSMTLDCGLSVSCF